MCMIDTSLNDIDMSDMLISDMCEVLLAYTLMTYNTSQTQVKYKL